ncbi:AmiS/UreI transporter [Arthrobacter crystallopoietes BAB-32]|uniref:AmiS/UreI transporter n=1 Tax=Arthrobacter crystallopoietes BAB-32 TaxID=1246476 RepID=N1V6J4_9MICC|nr:AmiS/UreI family transporter [Arthrobacter crystallopoietes]EMY33853.1 AmiS/UreI transporter [Arthrobacter crystallopoietes BAB-32]
MSFICLILSGVALLINGLALLGRIPPRDSGTLNLLIGGLQLVLAALIAVAAAGDSAQLLSAAGVVLFGLTYTYVGLNSLFDLGSAGVGWFCALVAALAVVYSASNLAADPFAAVLWASWAVLWTLFFLLLAGGRSGLTAYTGWATLLTSQITTAVPALLGLNGAWPAGWGSAAAAAVVIALLLIAARFLAQRNGRAAVVLPETEPVRADKVRAPAAGELPQPDQVPAPAAV